MNVLPVTGSRGDACSPGVAPTLESTSQFRLKRNSHSEKSPLIPSTPSTLDAAPVSPPSLHRPQSSSPSPSRSHSISRESRCPAPDAPCPGQSPGVLSTALGCGHYYCPIFWMEKLRPKDSNLPTVTWLEESQADVDSVPRPVPRAWAKQSESPGPQCPRL